MPWQIVAGAVAFAVSGVACADTVLFRDSFDDGIVETNTGPEAIGDDSPWNRSLYTAEGWGFPKVVAESGGALRFSSGADWHKTAIMGGDAVADVAHGGAGANVPQVGPTFSTAAPGVKFKFVTSSMVPVGGECRFLFGIADTEMMANNDEDIWTNSGPGVYLGIYRRADGSVLGSLQVARDKPLYTDDVAQIGLKEVAVFELPGYDGLSELTTELTLFGNTGYDLKFNGGAIVPGVWGGFALDGSWGAYDSGPSDPLLNPFFESGDLDMVNLHVQGQNWWGGANSTLDVNMVEVSQVPEPVAAAGLMVLSAILARRRK